MTERIFYEFLKMIMKFSLREVEMLSLKSYFHSVYIFNLENYKVTHLLKEFRRYRRFRKQSQLNEIAATDQCERAGISQRCIKTIS